MVVAIARGLIAKDEERRFSQSWECHARDVFGLDALRQFVNQGLCGRQFGIHKAERGLVGVPLVGTIPRFLGDWINLTRFLLPVRICTSEQRSSFKVKLLIFEGLGVSSGLTRMRSDRFFRAETVSAIFFINVLHFCESFGGRSCCHLLDWLFLIAAVTRRVNFSTI